MEGQCREKREKGQPDASAQDDIEYPDTFDARYDQPAIKLHTEDVLKLKHIGGWWKQHESGPNLLLVWLQGEVISCTDDLNQIEIEDEGCTVTVTGCQHIPRGAKWLSRGQYVLVNGEVECRGSVKAVKLVDLSDNDVHKTAWATEVAEAKALIAENPGLFM